MVRRFRVSGPNIVGDVIDGEALIIKLETGTYYSITGSGAEIWAALARGESTDEARATLLARYEGDPGEIGGAMDALIAELEREDVLVADPAVAGPPAASDASPPARIPFAPPVLERFDDMEAILLLDPIHEVDPTGWPAARPGD